MIVAVLQDAALRAALLRVAHPDEDVVFGVPAAQRALCRGFPRGVVRLGRCPLRVVRDGRRRPVAEVVLAAETLAAWRTQRRAEGVPWPWMEVAARRLEPLVSELPRMGWVDSLLRDFARAAGRVLPAPFIGLARRVLEDPARYGNPRSLVDLTGVSAQALKARFRRRALPSPATHVRWFRSFAAGHLLREEGQTTLQAALWLETVNSGNLCRMIQATTGLTPTEVRLPGGWERLLLRFARSHLADPALSRQWDSLAGLFLRVA